MKKGRENVLEPVSVLIGVVIGWLLTEAAEYFIERRAANKRMRKAAVEKRQC